MNILDNDLYKFTMWNIVSKLYPDVDVRYKAIDRKSQLQILESYFKSKFIKNNVFDDITFTHQTLDENDFNNTRDLFAQNFPGLNIPDLKYFNSYSDKWKDTILYEVPFLSYFSEQYYKIVLDDRWLISPAIQKTTINKLKRLNEIGKYYDRKVVFSELGTRRRISQNYQSEVLRAIKFYVNDYKNLDFKGTSNVWLGLKYDLPIVGTVAHEWIMAHSVLNSIQNANYYALKVWKDFYPNDFKVALTDTYGTNNFFRNFDPELKDHYTTLRYDSGDPIEFIKKVIYHYKDNKYPTLLFSDSVNDGVVESIFKYLKDNNLSINVVFGIGTWFTAKPYDNFETLNIVLKLDKVNGIPVCKLSDEPGKESGNPEMVELTKNLLRYYGDLK